MTSLFYDNVAATGTYVAEDTVSVVSRCTIVVLTQRDADVAAAVDLETGF